MLYIYAYPLLRTIQLRLTYEYPFNLRNASKLALSGCHLFFITLRTLFVICHTAHLKIDFVRVLSTWEETTCMNAVSTPIDALYGQKGLPWAENRHFGLHDRRDLQFYNIFNTQSHACRIVRQPHHLAPNL